MIYIYFLIAFTASTIGSISGIGGGIIIKPVLDAFSGLSAQTISFMSGCTVLAMALSSFVRGLKSEIKLNYAISIWLAMGGAVGGYIGKTIFSYLPGNIKLIQAIILLLVNLLVFVYIKNRCKVNTLHLKNKFASFLIGLSLGIVSAFLGIGGGPINIAVLSFFFSFPAKVTAKNSLFIILFSQLTSFVTTFATNTVPEFDLFAVIVMSLAGVAGAIVGAEIYKKVNDKTVEKSFQILLCGLIILNIYNIFCAV